MSSTCSQELKSRKQLLKELEDSFKLFDQDGGASLFVLIRHEAAALHGRFIFRRRSSARSLIIITALLLENCSLIAVFLIIVK